MEGHGIGRHTDMSPVPPGPRTIYRHGSREERKRVREKSCENPVRMRTRILEEEGENDLERENIVAEAARHLEIKLPTVLSEMKLSVPLNGTPEKRSCSTDPNCPPVHRFGC